MLENVRIDCPYCGEPFDVEVDCSAGNDQYVEDCQVCCQPVLVITNVDPDGALLGVTATREND